MLGMLQIMIYLLCIYLVFKGAEILQIAVCSSRYDRSGPIAFGIVALIFSILIAIGFVYWADSFAQQLSNQMPKFP